MATIHSGRESVVAAWTGLGEQDPGACGGSTELVSVMVASIGAGRPSYIDLEALSTESRRRGVCAGRRDASRRVSQVPPGHHLRREVPDDTRARRQPAFPVNGATSHPRSDRHEGALEPGVQQALIEAASRVLRLRGPARGVYAEGDQRRCDGGGVKKTERGRSLGDLTAQRAESARARRLSSDGSLNRHFLVEARQRVCTCRFVSVVFAHQGSGIGSTSRCSAM